MNITTARELQERIARKLTKMAEWSSGAVLLMTEARDWIRQAEDPHSRELAERLEMWRVTDKPQPCADERHHMYIADGIAKCACPE